MSLIEITNVEGTTVTATTISEHFAMHPAVMVEEESGELHLDTSTWMLVHRHSQQAVAQIRQEDRYEFPGEDAAINPEKVAKFVAWLESILDCSVAQPDWRSLTAEQQKLVSLWRDNCNDWVTPKADQAEGGESR